MKNSQLGDEIGLTGKRCDLGEAEGSGNGFS